MNRWHKIIAFLITATAFGLYDISGCYSTADYNRYASAVGIPEYSRLYDKLDRLLKKYTGDDGRVNYRDWVQTKEDRLALKRFLGDFTRQTPYSHPAAFTTKEAALAWYINFYNAVVIDFLLDRYPVGSVRHVHSSLSSYVLKGKGFFFDLRFRAGGETLNLKTLEDQYIRQKFNDPRIHFAVNCASVSCPPLQPAAFRPADLESRLDAAAAQFINSPGNVRVDHKKKTVYLSMIFSWYRSDFTARGRSLEEMIRHYALPRLNADLEKARAGDYPASFLPYDWALNSRHKPKPAD